ncbi:hypothetical protein [Clostridium kluyveri]|uniref:Uncharacterized protein n=1 Tax=Clostridium kluyveri TaxID=1534 RepID=A0A1L5FEG9_CLOKL|nr:hypothetical protein [Clostridium kluyveri]APM41373.1 hypothetical protein BS101_21945 [Clostridium kluyveri]
MESEKNFLVNCIKMGKLKKVTEPWHGYLKDKKLIVFKIGTGYNLISIDGEKGEKNLEGLCKYAWENDPETTQESGYDCVEDFIEEVNLGNDGFGFNEDEIEICDMK